jgi:ABC-type multidrug transport system fused ATPase/permease subunit
MVEGILVGAYFILVFFKYSVLSLIVLHFNEDIHQQMIHSLIRSCNYYYDITPVGQLNNKFSNDIGVLDNSMIFTLIQAF